MAMIRIKFKEREGEGFTALAKQCHVVCFKDGTYSVNRFNLKILDEKAIPYEVVAEETLDHTFRTLRNSAATHL